MQNHGRWLLRIDTAPRGFLGNEVMVVERRQLLAEQARIVNSAERDARSVRAAVIAHE